MTPSVRLLPPDRPRSLPTLDPVQREVAELPRGGGNVLVLGAPGTGKTTAATALVERRLRALPSPAGSTSRREGGAVADPAGDLLMLVPNRSAATRLREEVTARLDRTVGQVLVRTPASIAFWVLRRRAALLGEPSPALVTGPEQDAVLGELLAGHRAGDARAPSWPDHVPPRAIALRAFRDELRDVLMRAAEAGLDAAGLAALGRRRRRPEWVAAASVLREYEQVLQLGQVTPDRGERFDAARIMDEAVAALRSWSRVVPGSQAPRFGTVIVDDHQDSTLAVARLLRAFADDGAQLVLLGDPDTAVHGFRGGSPGLLGRAEGGPDMPGGFSASRLVLETAWRQPSALRAATAAVTARLAATGPVVQRAAVARRDAPGGAGPGGVELAVARTPAEEAAHVAGIIREEHLRHGTAYARMAVVVRSGAQAAALRRRLAGSGVPVVPTAREAPLRTTPAASALLLVLDAATAGELTPDHATALLSSPIVGSDRLDAVSLRALRRAVRALAPGADSAPGADGAPGAVSGAGAVPGAGAVVGTPDELIARLLADPARCEALPAHLRAGPARVASMLAATRTAAEEPGATAESVLWAAWERAGVAEQWRRAALGGGPAGERADRDLDTVLELFRTAEQFVAGNPAARPGELVRHLERHDLPGDSLTSGTSRMDAVEVLTAAGAAGREWDVVVVPGVQESIWPDLRLRDSLLGAHELADIAAGRDPLVRDDPARARVEVLQDELRSFAVAVSRARRRLVVTAVRDSERDPSPFLDLLGVEPAPVGVRPAVPLDLREMVARLRAELPDGPDAAAAAALLADLADRGVPGADPSEWTEALEDSSDRPLWDEGQPVELSPSTLETAQSCALRWALEHVGGRRAPGTGQTLGTLVHAIAADHPHGTHAELAAELDRRWSELGLPDGWLGRRRRRDADEMIRRLADYFQAHPGRVDVEQPVDVRIGRASLRGRVDRVEHGPDGTVRIVDLKTGSSPKSAQSVRSDPQLGAYQEAVRVGALGPDVRPGGAALVYVGANKDAAIRTQAAPEDGWAGDLLADVVRTVAAASFEATPCESCRTCPVRSSCPALPEGARP